MRVDKQTLTQKYYYTLERTCTPINPLTRRHAYKYTFTNTHTHRRKYTHINT